MSEISTKPSQEYILDKDLSLWYLWSKKEDGNRGEVLATSDDPVRVVEKYFGTQRGIPRLRDQSVNLAVPGGE